MTSFLNMDVNDNYKREEEEPESRISPSANFFNNNDEKSELNTSGCEGGDTDESDSDGRLSIFLDHDIKKEDLFDEDGESKDLMEIDENINNSNAEENIAPTDDAIPKMPKLTLLQEVVKPSMAEQESDTKQDEKIPQVHSEMPAMTLLSKLKVEIDPNTDGEISKSTEDILQRDIDSFLNLTENRSTKDSSKVNEREDIGRSYDIIVGEKDDSTNAQFDESGPQSLKADEAMEAEFNESGPQTQSSDEPIEAQSEESILQPTRDDEANSSVSDDGKKASFVDSLLDKIRRKNSDSSGPEMTKFQQILSESDEDLLVEIDAPVRYNVPSNPELLPTPIVHNPRSTSAFMNDEDEYRKTVAKHQSSSRKPQSQDQSKMCAKSEPPKMLQPPTHIARPRTVAEKRQLVKSSNLKFLMIEQESKIFRQVQRKKEVLEVNHHLLNSILLEEVPINKGPWKVLTWLRTRDGNYIQQYQEIDGKFFKINGSRGNHTKKFLNPQSSLPLPKHQTTMLRSTRCCSGGRIRKRLIESIVHSASVKKFVLEEVANVYKRMDTKYLDNQLISIKPRPLSHKIAYMNKVRQDLDCDDDRAFLGDYSKYEMPDVKIELNIQPKASLDPVAKKYLKEILPHRDLNENWCEFALSALVANGGEIEKNEEKKSFEFIIPYQDNKRTILVRDILRAKEDNEQFRIISNIEDETDDVDEMEWTFAKDADKDDPIECEVVDIIKDLTNSVFINLNDDLFTQEYPVEASSVASPIKVKEAIEELSTIVKPDLSKRLLLELKRLNANVFRSDSACVEDENDMREHAMAHLGRIERELRPTVILTESDTVLLGNNEKESRRTKRAPKKFDDYDNGIKSKDQSDSDGEEPASKKPKVKVDSYQHDTLFKRRSSRPSEGINSFEEMKAIKQEVQKMIHVSCDVRRLEEFDDIETYCMIHNLYKCQCQRHVPIPSEVEFSKPTLPDLEKPKSLAWNKPKPPQPDQEDVSPRPRDLPPTNKNTDWVRKAIYKNDPASESDEELVDGGASQRVLPVDVDAIKSSNGQVAKAMFKSFDGVPKIELVNLCDLINGGMGPIFIHIYDDSTMRLNPILRTVLNNRCAIVYFEGCGYFVDQTRIDVATLDFKSLGHLDHPIFIIQAKSDFPKPVSSTMTDDFVKILFKNDSSVVIEIKEKLALSEIANIIDSILKNVKKKLEAQIEGEPTEHVKEQLAMINRDPSRSRSASTSSLSSTHSSPLTFQGVDLTSAPPPGKNTGLMKEFNHMFTVRMQRLVALVNSNTMGLRPSNEMINKFYIYRWSLLLKSFEEDLIQIWQVKLEAENGDFYQLLVLSDTTERPEVAHARKENIVNIRKLSLITDNVTELTRLILLRVEKANMNNMTILLYGCAGYFRICGILNSIEDYRNSFVARPNRSAHPRIAAKVQKIYHIWHASRISRIKREMDRDRAEKIMRLSLKANLPVAPGLRKTEHKILPRKKPGQSDFKWFLFNVTSDFSDIFIKSWSRYLSFKVIMEAIQKAKTCGRAVALKPSSKFIKSWPEIYALPAAPLKFKEHDSMTDNFLIFGPYQRNSNSNLLLMQNCDGELMLRDEYEKRNNIRRETRTRCLWIYANTLKCIHDADPTPLKLMWGQDGLDSQLRTESTIPNLKIAAVSSAFVGEIIEDSDGAAAIAVEF